jgi:hypothetical protein
MENLKNHETEKKQKFVTKSRYKLQFFDNGFQILDKMTGAHLSLNALTVDHLKGFAFKVLKIKGWHIEKKLEDMRKVKPEIITLENGRKTKLWQIDL